MTKTQAVMTDIVTVMYPVTPTGKWGKEKPVTVDLSSYNARFGRLRVTDEKGQAFIINLPRDLCADIVARIDEFNAKRRPGEVR